MSPPSMSPTPLDLEALMADARVAARKQLEKRIESTGVEPVVPLAALPAWTSPLIEACGLDDAVKTAQSADLLDRHAGGLVIFAAGVRRAILRRLDASPSESWMETRSRLASALESAALRSALPSPIRRAAQLVVEGDLPSDRPDALVEAVDRRVGDAIDHRALGSAEAWIDAAESLLGDASSPRVLEALLPIRRRASYQLRFEHDRRTLGIPPDAGDEELDDRGTFVRRTEQEDAIHRLLAGGPDDPAWGLHVLGAGGAGKTMLIRRTVVRPPRDAASGRPWLVARIDFDFLSPGYPLRDPGALLQAFVHELAGRAPTAESERMTQSFRRTLEQLREAMRRDATPGTPSDPLAPLARPEFADVLRAFTDLIDLLGQPVLLVLDTCEELAKLHPEGTTLPALDATFAILERLHAERPEIRVLFAGRRPLARRGGGIGTDPWTFGDGGDTFDLARLPDAKPWLDLHVVRGFDESEAQELIERVCRRAEADPPSPAARDALLDMSRDVARLAQVSWTPPRIDDETERYSPFDVHLLSLWAAAGQDFEQLAGPGDPYVRVRIVERLEPRLVPLVPVLAALVRVDAAMLATCASELVDDSSAAFRLLAEQEWIHVDHSGPSPALEVDEKLLPRLRRHVAAEMSTPDDLADRLAEHLLGQDPRSIAAAHVRFVVAELAPAGAIEWWHRIERACSEVEDWSGLRTLAEGLLEDGAPVSGADHPMRASVLASRIAATMHASPGFALAHAWDEVSDAVPRAPAGPWRDWLDARARLGTDGDADSGAESIEAVAESLDAIDNGDVRIWARRQLAASVVARALRDADTIDAIAPVTEDALSRRAALRRAIAGATASLSSWLDRAADPVAAADLTTLAHCARRTACVDDLDEAEIAARPIEWNAKGTDRQPYLDLGRPAHPTVRLAAAEFDAASRRVEGPGPAVPRIGLTLDRLAALGPRDADTDAAAAWALAEGDDEPGGFRDLCRRDAGRAESIALKPLGTTTSSSLHARAPRFAIELARLLIEAGRSVDGLNLLDRIARVASERRDVPLADAATMARIEAVRRLRARSMRSSLPDPADAQLAPATAIAAAEAIHLVTGERPDRTGPGLAAHLAWRLRSTGATVSGEPLDRGRDEDPWLDAALALDAAERPGAAAPDAAPPADHGLDRIVVAAVGSAARDGRTPAARGTALLARRIALQFRGGPGPDDTGDPSPPTPGGRRRLAEALLDEAELMIARDPATALRMTDLASALAAPDGSAARLRVPALRAIATLAVARSAPTITGEMEAAIERSVEALPPCDEPAVAPESKDGPPPPAGDAHAHAHASGHLPGDWPPRIRRIGLEADILLGRTMMAGIDASSLEHEFDDPPPPDVVALTGLSGGRPVGHTVSLAAPRESSSAFARVAGWIGMAIGMVLALAVLAFAIGAIYEGFSWLEGKSRGLGWTIAIGLPVTISLVVAWWRRLQSHAAVRVTVEAAAGPDGGTGNVASTAGRVEALSARVRVDAPGMQWIPPARWLPRRRLVMRPNHRPLVPGARLPLPWPFHWRSAELALDVEIDPADADVRRSLRTPAKSSGAKVLGDVRAAVKPTDSHPMLIQVRVEPGAAAAPWESMVAGLLLGGDDDPRRRAHLEIVRVGRASDAFEDMRRSRRKSSTTVRPVASPRLLACGDEALAARLERLTGVELERLRPERLASAVQTGERIVLTGSATATSSGVAIECRVEDDPMAEAYTLTSIATGPELATVLPEPVVRARPRLVVLAGTPVSELTARTRTDREQDAALRLAAAVMAGGGAGIVVSLPSAPLEFTADVVAAVLASHDAITDDDPGGPDLRSIGRLASAARRTALIGAVRPPAARSNWIDRMNARAADFDLTPPLLTELADEIAVFVGRPVGAVPPST